jgi:rare lipoprotein A (peptidoglycan hydrolase)
LPRRSHAIPLALATALPLLAAPASAAAEPAPGAPTQAASAPADPAPPAGGLAADVAAPVLFTRPGELLGRTLRLRGRVAPEHAGRIVAIQRLDATRGWVPAAQAQAAADGAFLARWRTDAAGRLTLRAIVPASGAQVAAAPATTHVTVYTPARATWYGPGLFGRRTACGQRLTRRLIGVAHRTLPCGTPVEIFHRGRTITVPVVDRGPFAHGAHYDLTAAAARRIGLAQSVTIGVIARRGPQQQATPPDTAPAREPAPASATGGAGTPGSG